MNLTEEQSAFVEAALSGEGDAILFGKAGVGKSYTVRALVERAERERIAHYVLAPTGIAALNVGGETVHRFMARAWHLGMKQNPPRFILIDEVSMLRADVLDELAKCLRDYTGDRSRAFGRTKVVFVGDCAQLPPVAPPEEAKALVDAGYRSPWFFSSEAFAAASAGMKFFELTQIFRQSSANYVALLDAARRGEAKRVVDYLNANRRTDEARGIVIATTNAAANRYNYEALDRLSTNSETFRATFDGNWPKHVFPAEVELTLKPGARAMCVKNVYDEDSDERGALLVNGDLGTITDLNDDGVLFRPDRLGEDVIVGYQTWKYEERTCVDGEIKKREVGRFSQLPFRLAWATTVHKSQGQTFEEYTIDARSRFFDRGQAYVALSRGTNLQKLWIRGTLRESDVFACPVMSNFLELRAESPYVGRRLTKQTELFQEKLG